MSIARLKSIAGELESALSDHATRAEKITSSPRVRPDADRNQRQAAADAVRTELAALTTATREKVQALKTEAESLIPAAARSVELDFARSFLRPEPASTNDALLRELKASRIWNRHRSVLEASKSVGEVIHYTTEQLRKAYQSGDADAVEVLLVEAGPYAAKFGSQDAEHVESTLRQEMLRLDPEKAKALQAAEAARKGIKSLQASLKIVAGAVERGGQAGLFRWEGGFVEYPLGQAVTDGLREMARSF